MGQGIPGGVKGSSEGMKGLLTATSSFFPSPSGYKESPGKFIGHNTAVVRVAEGKKPNQNLIHEISKMQVS